MGKNVTPKINVNSDDLTKKIGELIAMGLTAGMLEEISNVKSVTRDEYVALKEAVREPINRPTEKHDVGFYTPEEWEKFKETQKQLMEDIKKPVVKNSPDALKYLTGDVNVDHFGSVLSEMLYIYAKKNADYGNSFDKSLDEDGLLVAKIRLGDKMNRFASLINGEQQVHDESIRDTLVDLANYAAMTVKWLDGKTNKEG